MNGWRRENGFRTVIYSLLGLVVILSITLMGMSPRHPLRDEPTPRNTPTPEKTWTTTPTFTLTATPTHTPGTPTATSPPTSTSPPEPTEAPTETKTPTITRTPTRTPTGTPGLTPVTPILGTVTVIYEGGTRLPISGVELTSTPKGPPTDTPTPSDTPTPLPTSTRAPSPTITPTPTPGDRLGPAAPSGLVATAGNGVVVLEWTPNKEEDLDGYRVYRSSAQGSGYSKMVSVTKKLARYVDNTVTNDVTYYYVVSAFDVTGNESPFSDEVSIMPSALKGMPASGASLGETLMTSPWVWAGVLGATLFVLVGKRRSEGGDPTV